MKTDGYSWIQGATLDDHSRRKHTILRDYFRQYLTVRCALPQRTRFRLAIVDGFAGGGRYRCGSAGSPILFIEELERTLNEINIRRSVQGMAAVEIEALLIFNDAMPDVTAMLRSYCDPLAAALKDRTPNLKIQIAYLSEEFENAYPKIKQIIFGLRFRNVIYNLDQYGYAAVKNSTLLDIMRTPSAPSTEVFYTFAIETLLAYLSARDPLLLQSRLGPLGVNATDMSALDGLMTKSEWLGTAERLVYDALKASAPYVSPFSIRNPEGWRYWMLHFANNYRARQEYNGVLHANGELAHFGRSGLRMLDYNPEKEGSLYLFDDDGRTKARDQLLIDIPRLVSESGDAMTVSDFYEAAYSETPAHKDDIHVAMLSNEDLEIATPNGGVRRRPNTIEVGDIIRLKDQRSFFQILAPAPKLPR